MLKKLFLSLLLIGSISCVLPKPKPPVPPPPPPVRTVATIVKSTAGGIVEGAACRIQIDVAPGWIDGVTSNTGYVAWNGVYSRIRSTNIECSKAGYRDMLQPVTLKTGDNEDVPPVAMDPLLPPYPTRDQLATAQLTFQGLWLDCPGEYTGPVFDVMLDVLTAGCRQNFYAMKRAAGDKVIALAISHAYFEPGVPAKIQEGKDWSNDLPGFVTLVDEVVREGFYVQLHLAGDGESNPSRTYNDPGGWTYGYDWLMENIDRIEAAIGPYWHYMRQGPGFDAVFYGWEPSGVKIPAFAAKLRAIHPDAVIFLEFNQGHIPIGEGTGDYEPGGRMQGYDLLLGEINAGLNDDTFYQIVGRLVPVYHRPPEQPAWDDPNPPFMLGKPGPRGQFYFNCFEWNLYDWVRSRITAEQLQKDRLRLTTAGCYIVG